MLDVRAVISIENVRTVDLSLNTGPSFQGRSMVQEFASETEGSLSNKDTIRVQGAICLLQGTAILALGLRDRNAGSVSGLGQSEEGGTRRENNNNKLYGRFIVVEMIDLDLIVGCASISCHSASVPEYLRVLFFAIKPLCPGFGPATPLPSDIWL